MMSNKEDRGRSRKTGARANTLLKALDYGLEEALELDGVELLGIAFKQNEASCLMTLKVFVNTQYQVAFIGSDSIIGCVLKAYGDARNNHLHYQVDKFATK